MGTSKRPILRNCCYFFNVVSKFNTTVMGAGVLSPTCTGTRNRVPSPLTSHSVVFALIGA
jgi:hypothetical protein